jgi:hypothetical protein
VVAAYYDRCPKRLYFIRPAIGAFLHLQMESLLDAGEEFQVLSLVEGAHEKSVRGVVVPVISSIEGDRVSKMVHKVTSDVFG